MLARYRYLLHRCFLCWAPTRDYLCPGCANDLPRIESACAMCALPLPATEAARSLCGDCLRNEKPFLLSICPFAYTYPLDHLIRRLKTRDPYAVGRYLAAALVDAVDQGYEDDRLPDALVPTPLHWRRRLWRGHNQTEVLCDFLAHHTGIVRLDALAKIKPTTAQRALSRKARLANLSGAFVCRQSVIGKHLAVVEDVVTTCATTTRMAECLLASGATRVDVWALARTP